MRSGTDDPERITERLGDLLRFPGGEAVPGMQRGSRVSRRHRSRSCTEPAKVAPEIADESLTILLLRMFATDLAHDTSSADPVETARLCRQAILQRLIRGELRRYVSRLIRELYLSEDALSMGLGVDDARRFLRWFDCRLQSALSELMGLPAAPPDDGDADPFDDLAIHDNSDEAFSDLQPVGSVTSWLEMVDPVRQQQVALTSLDE